MRFLVIELLCIAMVAAGLWLWVAPGCGLVAAGALGLLLVTVAQLPSAGDG